MIRIAVIDDHPIVRQGISRLLEEEDDFEVVAQGLTGADVPPIIAEHDPDVLVLDLSMPEVDGLTALAEAASSGGRVPATVVLTMRDDATAVQEALAFGARAYVLKQAVAGELVDAVRVAARGGLYLCPEVVAPDRSQVGDRLARLSPRERQVADLICAGLSTKQIATRLETSMKTVQKQRQAAMRKLEAPNTAVLVRRLLDAAPNGGRP